MSLQPMDADTAETVAGVIRLLRRAAELVWAAVDGEGAGSRSATSNATNSGCCAPSSGYPPPPAGTDNRRTDRPRSVAA